MKKTIFVCFLFSFFLIPLTTFAEVSQADQQKAAKRAYEASASSYNEVASAPKKAAAQVKKATSQVKSTGKGATMAVRG